MARRITITKDQTTGSSTPIYVRSGKWIIMAQGTIGENIGDDVHLEFDYGPPLGFGEVVIWSESDSSPGQADVLSGPPVLEITQAAMDGSPSGFIMSTQILPAGLYRCRIQGAGSTVTIRMFRI